MNEKGEVIENEIDVYGQKVTHQIIHSEMCIYFDEKAINISMKGESNMGGQKYLCAAGTTH